jgi:FAD/FMN-containing dehydrogenase
MSETATAGASTLDRTALDELRSDFRGEIIEPGSDRYDAARVVFNAMFDRRPAVILRPAGTADVIRGIGLARVTGVPLAVCGGRHSVAGFSLCDDGVVIDMSAMKGIRVDPNKRTVRAQAGLNWGEFDRETQAFGLATTGGRVTTTGIAGFTLGSGSGWLERSLGFASDNLISADIVTADGEVVTATEDENADLLWGLRGGGGNFGVVTELEFRVAPVGPIVYGGLAAFRPEQGAELVRRYRDVCETAPEALGWAVASICLPPEPFVPAEWQGKRTFAIAGMFAGAPDEAERVLEPVRSLGPLFDLFQPMPYTAFQSVIDPANPYGRHNYWRAHNVSDLGDGVIDTFIDRANAAPSPFTASILIGLGGAIGRMGEDDSALGGRSAPFAVHLNCMWEGAEHSEENIAWVRGTSDALGPHIAPGIGLNFATQIDDAALAEGFGERIERLRALKDRYDPTNLFRLNQNIAPSGA